MDDARKLLDSLMGQTRNASLDKAKENKGKNFTQDNVCKFHLLGFCPQHELHNSKLTTKRNLGLCEKVHSEAMKEEYEKHPDKAKYQAEYEGQFLPFLESQVREADAWVARERANVQKTANSTEKTTISTMPEPVKAQVAALTDDLNKMMASAEELAEKGDIEGSKFKVMLADEIKEKVREIEEKHPSYTVTLREEWVCEICGTRTEAVNENNTARFAAHFTGKVHLGYAKIRDWVKDIRTRMREADVARCSREAKEDREKDGGGGGTRKQRSRSRDRREGASDGPQRRGSNDDRSSRRHGGRSRSRSRGGGRRDRGGGDRRDRRRSRSREDRGGRRR